MTDFLIGLASSIIASFIIIYFLRFIKPRISFSEKIAKGKSSEGQTEFQIKILNRTRRDIIDINAELYLIKPFTVKGGIIPENRKVDLKISNRMIIAGKGKKIGRELYEGANFIFLTYENIENLWVNGSYLSISVGVTDSFSGVRKVFTKEYFNPNNIKLGEFEKGDSLIVQ